MTVFIFQLRVAPNVIHIFLSCRFFERNSSSSSSSAQETPHRGEAASGGIRGLGGGGLALNGEGGGFSSVESRSNQNANVPGKGMQREGI